MPPALARCRLVASLSREKADFLNIVAVLKGRPDIVSDLKQRFINDEILLPTGEVDPN